MLPHGIADSRALEHAPSETRWLWLAGAVCLCAVAFYLVEHSFTMSVDLAAMDSESAEMDDLVAAGNTLRRLAFAALGVAGLIAWRWPRRQLAWTWSAGGVALLAYFSWCLLSIFWADDPVITSRRFGVLVFSFLAMMGLARQLTPRQIAWLALAVGTAHLLWGIWAEICLHMFHPVDEDYRFAGTVHPNTQGMQCTGVCLAAYALQRPQRRGRWLWALLFALAAAALLLTRSRTSCAAALLALVLMWLPRAPRWVQVSGLLAPPLLASAVLLGSLLLDLDLQQHVGGLVLLGRQEEAGTLTGRLPLWEELSGYAAQRPLVGYGYGGFWNVERTRRIADSQGWQIAHSHSAYFETQLNLGAVGLLLACAAGLIAGVKATWRFWTTGDPGWGFFCGLFAFAGVYSLTDAGFALPGFMTLVFYAALAHTLCWTERCAPSAAPHAAPAFRSSGAVGVQVEEAIA